MTKPVSTRLLLASVVALPVACLLGLALGDPANANDRYPRAATEASPEAAGLAREAVVGLHMDSATFATTDCLTCHGNRYDDRSPQDAAILTGHAAMLQHMYPPPGGSGSVSADTCRVCHLSADLVEDSAARIRKQVATEALLFQGQSCLGCHGEFYDGGNISPELVILVHNDPTAFAAADCIGCHGARYDEQAPLDARIPTAHAKKMRMRFPAGESSVTADGCRECHVSVDLIEKSAATLRKQVSLTHPLFLAQSCFSCHEGFYGTLTSQEVRQIILGLTTLDPALLRMADENGDGIVDIADMIEKMLGGM